MAERKTRVLIAKVGLDGHDRGAKLVARSLKDAGMEVVYTGLRQTVDQVINAAVQEGVDVLGLSFLSGDHMVMVPKIMQGLRDKDAEDVHVVVGGIILKHQAQALLGMGVHRVFLPGTPPDEIIVYIKDQVK